jgi:hypothetical protein
MKRELQHRMCLVCWELSELTAFTEGSGSVQWKSKP